MNSWLEKDFTLKVISVLVGIVLWFQVTAEQNPITPRTFQDVPVKCVNLESGIVVMETLPASVRVTVQSQKRLISGVVEDQVAAVVDLKGAEAGSSQFPVAVTLPPGIDLVETVPQKVTVTLDVQASRQIRPEIAVAGSPNENFVVSGVELRTPEVTLTGPRTRLQAVQKVVGQIDVNGAAADVTRSIDLRPVDADGRDVKMVNVEPRQVEATVVMRSLPPAKMVQVTPQLSGSPRSGFKVADVSAAPGEVRVRGPADRLRTLSSISTRRVDVSGQSFDFEKQADLVLPAGFSIEQKSVLVRVSIVEDRVQRTFSNLPVRVQNVSAREFKFSVEPNSVEVTIEGRRDQVEALTPEEAAQRIQPFISALGLGEGSHEKKVQVPAPDEFSVVKVSPENVTLTLAPR